MNRWQHCRIWSASYLNLPVQRRTRCRLANWPVRSVPNFSLYFRRRDKSVHVSYHPTLDQQTRYSPLGLAGTFEVQYDLQRRDLYGDITHANG